MTISFTTASAGDHVHLTPSPRVRLDGEMGEETRGVKIAPRPLRRSGGIDPTHRVRMLERSTEVSHGLGPDIFDMDFTGQWGVIGRQREPGIGCANHLLFFLDAGVAVGIGRTGDAAWSAGTAGAALDCRSVACLGEAPPAAGERGADCQYLGKSRSPIRPV